MKSRKAKKLTTAMMALVLSLSMILGVFPVSDMTKVYAASSGTCGENLTWTLDDNGVLTISGTGEMYDYDAEDYNNCSPWDSDYSYDITSVVIEQNVTSIGNYAFFNCRYIASVTIPSSVTSIGSNAFKGCELTSVTIPDGVTCIGNRAFFSTDLTSITIPKSVTSIGDEAFINNDFINIYVDEDNENYTSIDGVLFNKNKTELCIYPCGREGSYTIPNSVTSIGAYAFSSCDDLLSIEIPDGVTSIGIGAFQYCNKLASLTIPSGVKKIEDYTCQGCASIQNLTIPSSVTSIGEYAFCPCSSIKKLTIPSSVTSIGKAAFGNCKSLTDVIICKGLTSISDYTFSGCDSMTSITIPDSVTSIGESAFAGCVSLTDITIPDSVTSIGESAFSSCDSFRNITIPDSVTSMGRRVFGYCARLQSIKISNSVTSIAYGSFEACTLLSSITIPVSVTSIETNAFWCCDLLTDVFYSGTLDDWKKITIGQYNNALTHSKISYKSGPSVSVNGISISPTSLDLIVGESENLTVTISPENATNKKVTWTSNNSGVATVVDGIVTAVSVGETIIKAVAEDGGFEATCEITVKEAEPDNSESPLGPDKPDLSQYTASANEIAVKSINLKKAIFSDVKGIKKFEVTSGDTASVKIKGSTLTVLQDGTVTIAAENKAGEKLAEKTVKVILPVVKNTEALEISRRGNLDLNKYITSTVKPAKWKSSSKKIAEVTPDGLLIMKKAGKVKITVTFPAEKGMKAKTLTIKLNIKMPQFSKTTYTVKIGKTISTVVKNIDASNIAYRIEDTAIATVDSQGNVTGVSKGATKLIATIGGIDYETNIKVK